MTTETDRAATKFNRLLCPIRGSNLYPTMVLAMRDMRQAHGRDPETGEGVGNASWIAMSLAMIILDTLSGTGEGVGARWRDLLTRHGLSSDDADIVYRLRCSLLHGYGLPKLTGCRVALVDDQDAPAIDRSRKGFVLISVPVFCGVLVERVASESPMTWDVSEVEVTSLDTLFGK